MSIKTLSLGIRNNKNIKIMKSLKRVIKDAVDTKSENTLAQQIVKAAISKYGKKEAFEMGSSFLKVKSFNEKTLNLLIEIYKISFEIKDFSGNGLVGKSPLEYTINIK